jgi:hypothetical protein
MLSCEEEMKSTDKCKCGHSRKEHNNKSMGASYEYLMNYNVCMAYPCECLRFRLK